VPTLGKAVLGFAGAYLLRAVAESGVIPKEPVLVVAVAYASLWMVWAVRTGAVSRLQLNDLRLRQREVRLGQREIPCRIELSIAWANGGLEIKSTRRLEVRSAYRYRSDGKTDRAQPVRSRLRAKIVRSMEPYGAAGVPRGFRPEPGLYRTHSLQGVPKTPSPRHPVNS